jgi:hypothetical protein
LESQSEVAGEGAKAFPVLVPFVPSAMERYWFLDFLSGPPYHSSETILIWASLLLRSNRPFFPKSMFKHPKAGRPMNCLFDDDTPGQTDLLIQGSCQHAITTDLMPKSFLWKL